MTGKKIEKNNVTIAPNVLYAKKIKTVSWLCFQTLLKSRESSYSFNDSKYRRMTLCCSIKTISIIKRNNF